jgi:hypothetical protein
MSGNQLHAGFWARADDERITRARAAGRPPRLPRRFAVPDWTGPAALPVQRRDARPRWQLAAPTAWRFLCGIHERLVQSRRWRLQRH